MNNPIGKQLNQQSMSVLKNTKRLLLFPIISSLFTVFVLYCALQPLYRLEAVALTNPQAITTSSVIYTFIFVIFVFGFLNTLITLANCGLTAYALPLLQGKKSSLLATLKITVKKAWQACRWQAEANIMGAVLRSLLYWVDDFDQKPSMQKLLQGLPWSVATMLALPVLLNNISTPLQIITHSATLIRKTWGTEALDTTKTVQSQLSSNIGLSILKAIFFVFIILSALMHPSQNPVVMIILIASIIGFLSISILTTAIETLTITALYLFSQHSIVASHYDEKSLAQAFRMMPRRKLD